MAKCGEVRRPAGALERLRGPIERTGPIAAAGEKRPYPTLFCYPAVILQRLTKIFSCYIQLL